MDVPNRFSLMSGFYASNRDQFFLNMSSDISVTLPLDHNFTLSLLSWINVYNILVYICIHNCISDRDNFEYNDNLENITFEFLIL